MQIFLFTVCYFLTVGGAIFLILKLSQLIPVIKEETNKVNKLDKQIYGELREVQFKARELNHIANKLNKQKSSSLSELLQGIIVTLMPFRKLKSIMLIYSFFKKAVRK